MKTYQYRPVILVLMLAAVLMVGMPSWVLAQCGGGSGYGSMSFMHDQHMGSSGHMGSGQMGMYGSQAPVQMAPNALVAPAPPASGYTDPQNNGGYGYGQMMNQGGAASDHSGHAGH